MTDTALHWVDGTQGAAVPADDRGLLYGDGVFRTLRVDAGVVDDLDGQVGHLLADAAALQLPPPDTDRLRKELERAGQAVGQAGGQGIVRITLTRGSGGHGYAPSGCSQTRRIVIGRPLIIESKSQTLALLQPLPTRGVHAAKHLNRLVQVEAARLQPAWAGASLLQNLEGHLVCATQSNIFAVNEAEQLITPPLSDGALRGRMRARVLDAAASLGLVVREASLKLDDLAQCRGLFCASSVRGLEAVNLVADAHRAPLANWDDAADVQRQLMRRIAHPAHGAGA